MIDKIILTANRCEMISILESQDMWTSSFINEMDNNEMLKFGVVNGVWEKVDETKKGYGRSYGYDRKNIQKKLDKLRKLRI